MGANILAIYFSTAFKDPVIIFVVLVLAVLSILSWAIFLQKYFQLTSVRNKEEAIYRLIEKGSSKDRIIEDADGDTPFGVFVRLLSTMRFKEPKDVIESCELIARRNFSWGISILASAGSVSPFVGLLGTVWGIVKAFHSIGLQGSASLAVVAPGISEALVNTALGLFVAIPAVFFYNYVNGRIEDILERFRAYSIIFLNMEDKR